MTNRKEKVKFIEMEEKIVKKANEIILHYYRVIYPYVGSGFMTGTEDKEHKFNGAKKEAIYLINNIVDAMPSNATDIRDFINLRDYIYELKFSSEDWELLVAQ